MARIAREASEDIAVCGRILAGCNGYRHPRKRFERRLRGRMRGRKTRARCSPVRKERGRMPCRARVRLLKRHIQAYFPATFPIRKRRRAKTAQNSMWRCRLERNALIPLEISWRFGRCDAGRRFFAAAGTRAGKAVRTPPVMWIDGSRHTAAAYAPERRQKEAGGREYRKGDCALRWRRTCLLPWKTWNRKRGRALEAPSRNAQTRSVSESLYLPRKGNSPL